MFICFSLHHRTSGAHEMHMLLTMQLLLEIDDLGWIRRQERKNLYLRNQQDVETSSNMAIVQSSSNTFPKSQVEINRIPSGLVKVVFSTWCGASSFSKKVSRESFFDRVFKNKMCSFLLLFFFAQYHHIIIAQYTSLWKTQYGRFFSKQCTFVCLAIFSFVHICNSTMLSSCVF